MSAGNSSCGMKRRRICPSCKSEEVVPIVYGLPNEEAIKKAEEGIIALGGCLVDDDNPRWKCKACEDVW